MRRSLPVVLVVLTSLLPAPTVRAAVEQQPPRTILFSRTDESGTHIFAVEPEGSGLTQLTNGPTQDVEPAWTSDLSAITFTRKTGTTTDVWIMAPDGSDASVLLPNARSLVWGPYFVPGLWSPKGDRVAFVRTREGNVDIWTAAADGSDRIRLTTHGGRDSQPALTGDGRLAFVSDRSGRDRIYVMDADGTGVSRLTSGPGEQRHPSWYGQELVYEQDDGNDLDIVRMWTPTGSVQVEAGGGADDGDPDVAVDGELVFGRLRADGSSTLIHRWIELDGSSIALSEADVVDRHPAWAPISAWIRAQDDQAKGNLLEAAATAQGIRDDTGSFDDADVMGMDAANPSLTYLSSSVDSTAPWEISILPDGNSWSAAAVSQSGTCFHIRLHDVVGTTYALNSGASAASMCSGSEAAGAQGAAW